MRTKCHKIKPNKNENYENDLREATYFTPKAMTHRKVQERIALGKVGPSLTSSVNGSKRRVFGTNCIINNKAVNVLDVIVESWNKRCTPCIIYRSMHQTCY
jgi:hypothetical protein